MHVLISSGVVTLQVRLLRLLMIIERIDRETTRDFADKRVIIKTNSKINRNAAAGLYAPYADDLVLLQCCYSADIVKFDASHPFLQRLLI